MTIYQTLCKWLNQWEILRDINRYSQDLVAQGPWILLAGRNLDQI